MPKIVYVGLDVHKHSISVAIAQEGREGEVRFIGDFENNPSSIAKLCKKLSKDGAKLEFCYEAGCFGYGLYRQLISTGHGCMVVAPSRIPKAPGDRVKTDRRDAQRLAVLHRVGELTKVWVPGRTHEAMRDLVRARMDASMQLMRCRQQLLAFLLRHGRPYETGKSHWTLRHRRWLATQQFDEPAQTVVFQDYVEAVWTATDRKNGLAKRIEELVPEWKLGELVSALRCVRGLELVSAATILAAIGDISRFEKPQHLMSYLGLVPTEHSSGGRIRRGGITKTGNRKARRMLVEAAWSYRYPARVSQAKTDMLVKQPKTVRDIAWKTQERLCKRYRRLKAREKKSTVIVTAIARELAGFIWAMGQEIRPDES